MYYKFFLKPIILLIVAYAIYIQVEIQKTKTLVSVR